jgi:hypothetical protein
MSDAAVSSVNSAKRRSKLSKPRPASRVVAWADEDDDEDGGGGYMSDGAAILSRSSRRHRHNNQNNLPMLTPRGEGGGTTAGKRTNGLFRLLAPGKTMNPTTIMGVDARQISAPRPISNVGSLPRRVRPVSTININAGSLPYHHQQQQQQTASSSPRTPGSSRLVTGPNNSSSSSPRSSTSSPRTNPSTLRSGSSPRPPPTASAASAAAPVSPESGGRPVSPADSFDESSWSSIDTPLPVTPVNSSSQRASPNNSGRRGQGGGGERTKRGWGMR